LDLDLVFIGSGCDFIGVDDWLLKTVLVFRTLDWLVCFIGCGFV
jgi:hypothetical protein